MLEVLIAVFIIAVVAAIFVPVLSAARKRAQQSACLSHITQLGDAMLMYAEDHDSRLPHDVPFEHWIHRLQPYVKSLEVSCPLFETDAPPLPGYARNACVSRGLDAVDPARTVLVTEVANFEYLPWNGRQRGTIRPDSVSGPDIYRYPQDPLRGSSKFSVIGSYGSIRHGGGCNYTFLDGHASWFRPEQLRLPASGPGCFVNEQTVWRGPSDGPAFVILP